MGDKTRQEVHAGEASETQAAKVNPTSNKWEQILEIVSDNAFMDWMLLAKEFGVSPPEVDNIRCTAATYQQRCWKVLDLWKSACQPNRRPAVLVDVLKRCRHKRMADIVSRLLYHKGTLDDILGQHVEREERMREAFYVIADQLSANWRLVSQKLGLTPGDIADIEARFEGRRREKLMHALHKWRLLVPLQDYKVGNLIIATKAAGHHRVADELTKFTDTPQWTKPLRRRRTGEALVQIDLDHLDLLETMNQERGPQIMSSKETLRDYALNKIFLHLSDCLDDQDTRGTHPLVTYFYELNKASIIRVSRGGCYVLLRCESEADVDELRRLCNGRKFALKLTEFLVPDEILQELGLVAVGLRASIVDEELLTSRSYASSRASLQHHASTRTTPRP